MDTLKEYMVLAACGFIVIGIILMIGRIGNPNRTRNQANELVIQRDKRTEAQRNIQEETLRGKESNGLLWILLIFALLYIIFF